MTNRKEILLDAYRAAYSHERAYMEDLDSTQKARVGVLENWAPKDMIAHNAFWKQRIAKNVVAVSAGKEPEGVEDYNHENDRFFEENVNLSWDDVLNLFESAYQAILTTTETLTEETINSGDFFPWSEGRPLWRILIGNGFLHPMSHLAERYKQDGMLDKAAEMTAVLAKTAESIDDSPEWRGVTKYNVACAQALYGAKDKAIWNLGEALKLNPGLVEWSKQDPDLDSIRGDDAFLALYSD